jgi:hypothetical protein
MGVSCEKVNNCDAKKIIGKWEWIFSTGGIAGNTIYPKNGQTVTLELTKGNMLIERDNGEINFEAEFTLLGDTLKYYASDAEIICMIKISDDRLYLHYLKIYDGYNPVYKRIE